VQNPRPTPRGVRQTPSEIAWELTELAGGAAVMFLPLLLLAVPGIALFLVLPGLVLLAVALAPVAVAGAVLVPVYLLTRLVRRLPGPRRGTRRPSGGRRAPTVPARLSPMRPG
jgi:membrane protein implicated in regulation of membrane protease activity